MFKYDFFTLLYNLKQVIELLSPIFISVSEDNKYLSYLTHNLL